MFRATSIVPHLVRDPRRRSDRSPSPLRGSRACLASVSIDMMYAPTLRTPAAQSNYSSPGMYAMTVKFYQCWTVEDTWCRVSRLSDQNLNSIQQ